MAESEEPPPVGGGPRWQGRPDGGPSPSSVLSSAPGLDPHSTSGRSTELFQARFSRRGMTPVPYAAAAIAGMVATVWALEWAEVTAEAPDPVLESEWWVNVFAVLLPSEDVGIDVYSSFRMWTTIAVAVATALVIAAWIGRIGANVKGGTPPFGALLPIAAFPAWWYLPITLGLVGDLTPSRIDLLIRLLIGFGILIAQFLLLRWPLLNRIWRAGELPYDMWSIALWLPNLIPWSLLYLSTAFAVFDEGPDPAWEPTDAMDSLATGLTRLSGLGILILLLVVTGAQHVGMRRDRARGAAPRPS